MGARDRLGDRRERLVLLALEFDRCVIDDEPLVILAFPVARQLLARRAQIVRRGMEWRSLSPSTALSGIRSVLSLK